MKLEEYILQRKKEDGMNEYDLDKRPENTRICVNYVFEYFNNYLNTKPEDEKTVLHEQKIEKYRNIIQDYDAEVQDWLVSLYASYGKYMHINLISFINDRYFLLYDSEAEFRSLSYEIYPKAVKKFGFLEGQSEMVFLFLKDAHKVMNRFSSFDQGFTISDNIDEWIETTYKKFGVNIYNFCFEWLKIFENNPDMWPKGHKHQSDFYEFRNLNKYNHPNSSDYWDYDYRQKSNLFALDSLYGEMPKKSFTKGKKQEFEAVLMYCWLHSFETDEEYWATYIKNIL